ncbi:flagellar hook-length control protein FliK [Hoeflea sp.]|uniref:flagellar hook-length control protein FliK n=1 Tax=Hoeflea sp. TaxID=1940281 RepID=UPI003B02C30E
MNSNPPSNPGKGNAAETIALLGRDAGKKRGGGTANPDGAAFRTAVIEAGGKAASGAVEAPQTSSGRSDEVVAAQTRVHQGQADAPQLPVLNRPATREDAVQRPAGEVQSRKAPGQSDGLHTRDDKARLPQLIETKAQVEGKVENNKLEAALPDERSDDADIKPSLPEARQPETNSQPQQTPVHGLLSTLAPSREPVRSITNADVRQQTGAETKLSQPARLFAEVSKSEQRHNDGQAAGRSDGEAGEQGGARRALDIFAFARASDTMVNAGNSPPVARVEGREPVGASVNPVTVIEAKQFPGLSASQSSAAAIVSAVTGEPSWSAMVKGAEAISAQSLNQVQNTVNTLKIQLNPVELGTVDATLRLSGGQLVVELKVETIEAFRQLSDNQQIIVKALKNQGYTVEHMSVQPPGPERGVTQQSVAPSQGGSPASGDTSAQSGQQNSTGTGAEQRPSRNERDGQEHEHDGSNYQPVADYVRGTSDAVYL